MQFSALLIWYLEFTRDCLQNSYIYIYGIRWRIQQSCKHLETVLSISMTTTKEDYRTK